MITWTEFERRQPELAEAGRAQLYVHGLGLAFLATVRKDGAPRVHPVCPVISPAGLHVIILPGPKLLDLRRDGRYSLHSETVPPPREDDGFALSGMAVEMPGQDVRAIVARQLLAERGGVLWPGFDDHVMFELRADRALLTLTSEGDSFPKGPTVWRA